MKWNFSWYASVLSAKDEKIMGSYRREIEMASDGTWWGWWGWDRMSMDEHKDFKSGLFSFCVLLVSCWIRSDWCRIVIIMDIYGLFITSCFRNCFMVSDVSFLLLRGKQLKAPSHLQHPARRRLRPWLTCRCCPRPVIAMRWPWWQLSNMSNAMP